MFVMVLNDGETYTGLENCRIVWVSDEFDDDETEEQIKTIRRGESDPEKVATVRLFGKVPAPVDFYLE